jgi:hypothetical protein
LAEEERNFKFPHGSNEKPKVRCFVNVAETGKAGLKKMTQSHFRHYLVKLSANLNTPFILSVFFMISGFAVSYSYFRGFIPYDRFSWIFWFVSIALLVISVKPKRPVLSDIPRELIWFVLGITAFYFITHLMNYNTAPWNSYGLFDDGAWDIYFVQEFTQPGASVQIAFNDMEIGRIGRELPFHYYIGIWFKLFGFNLFVFNMALIFLGYITVLFTALLAYKIFDNLAVGAAAAVLINFYPMHFTQIFMGHRYAICAPLMMISLYYLYTGFKRASRTRAIVGGVFAALCMSSAIMGKQFVYGLLGTAFIYIVLHIRKRDELKTRSEIAACAVMGFLFAMTPLFSYMLVNNEVYTIRESSLIQDFFGRLKVDGLDPLWENMKLWYQTVFGAHNHQRQFMHNYPIIHWSILAFVVSGAVLAFTRKHYYVALMIAIPTAGCFVATSYDFRLLISAPFIILAVVFALYEVAQLIKSRLTGNIVVIAFTAALVISPVSYLYKLSLDTNGQYLLPHRSVAASRFIQDIVVGEKNPNFLMKKDEFRRAVLDYDYDTLAATRESYAHVHAYLHDYDAYKILDLLNNFPYRGRDPVVLKGYFKKAIADYTHGSKDLIIVLEQGNEISEIIHTLDLFEKGKVKEYSTVIDGLPIQMYTIRIKNTDMAEFKEYILLGQE